MTTLERGPDGKVNPNRTNCSDQGPRGSRAATDWDGSICCHLHRVEQIVRLGRTAIWLARSLEQPGSVSGIYCRSDAPAGRELGSVGPSKPPLNLGCRHPLGFLRVTAVPFYV